MKLEIRTNLNNLILGIPQTLWQLHHPYHSTYILQDVHQKLHSAHHQRELDTFDKAHHF